MGYQAGVSPGARLAQEGIPGDSEIGYRSQIPKQTTAVLAVISRGLVNSAFSRNEVFQFFRLACLWF